MYRIQKSKKINKESLKLDLNKSKSRNDRRKNAKAKFKGMVKDAFEVFDFKKDGKVDAEELKKTMLELGEVLSDDEVKCLIMKGDVSKTGSLSFFEFFNLMKELKKENY